MTLGPRPVRFVPTAACCPQMGLQKHSLIRRTRLCICGAVVAFFLLYLGGTQRLASKRENGMLRRPQAFSEGVFGIAVATIALLGCQPGTVPYASDPQQNESFTNAPDGEACTDPRKCCQADELTCIGNPDSQVICSCSGLWDCNLNQTKCSQPLSPPDGSGGWTCTEWNPSNGVICTRSGVGHGVPDGGGRWFCSEDSEHNVTTCKESVPSNPTNTVAGAGGWNCGISSSEDVRKINCDRKGGGSTPGESHPGGGGQWDCNAEQTRCAKTDGDRGLPSGSGSWDCHDEQLGRQRFLTCSGDTSGVVPDGGGRWSCENAVNSETTVTCSRPIESSDTPPGGGYWACVTGSEFGGRVCDSVDSPPEAPPIEAEPGAVCVPGTRRWCDGLVFCGWGMVTCKPDGTWPTKRRNGQLVLDCQERSDGKRPDTRCACHHFYFNPNCCERADCIVPEGTDGRICEASQGQFCDYCNPRNPECGGGGFCLIADSMETFCSKACQRDEECPGGNEGKSACVRVRDKPGRQCVPVDRSCYNGI